MEGVSAKWHQWQKKLSYCFLPLATAAEPGKYISQKNFYILSHQKINCKGAKLWEYLTSIYSGHQNVPHSSLHHMTNQPLNQRLLSPSWPNLAWTTTYSRCTRSYPKTRPQPQSSLSGGHFVSPDCLHVNGHSKAAWRLRPDFSLWHDSPRVVGLAYNLSLDWRPRPRCITNFSFSPPLLWSKY